MKINFNLKLRAANDFILNFDYFRNRKMLAVISNSKQIFIVINSKIGVYGGGKGINLYLSNNF